MSKIFNDIKIDDLCNLIALEVTVDISPQMVKRVLKATYKVILRQLQLNGRIYFKNFGVFKIKERATGERTVGDFNGGTRTVYVEPKKKIIFSPSEVFDISVNENNFIMAKNTNTRRKNEAKKRKKEEKIKNAVVEIVKKAEERIN